MQGPECSPSVQQTPRGVTGTSLLGSRVRSQQLCSSEPYGRRPPAQRTGKSRRGTHAQPLPPVGDPRSEGVWQVAEIPAAGAQLAASSVPVGTWNPAGRWQGWGPLCMGLQQPPGPHWVTRGMGHVPMV